MSTQDLQTDEWKFFVDKCLPFGASISCAHFQRFSNALKHLTEHRLQVRRKTTNYLDDFLFVARTILRCNAMIRGFLQLCEELGVLVSMDKTEWAAELTVFLGILLDGRNMLLAVPEEKRLRAVEMLTEMCRSGKKKATVAQLQKLCGLLNFLGKAIFPGTAFTRRMYNKFSQILNIGGVPQNSYQYKWKQHYHVCLDKEFKIDCGIWLQFLSGDLRTVANRPMVDLSTTLSSTEIGFYSDASATINCGFGAVLGTSWIRGDWTDSPYFLENKKLSIEYLELFALVAGVLTWQCERLMQNKRICVHCANMAVVHMVNNLSVGCKNYMFLIRLLVLNGLKFNRRITARYINAKWNGVADALSRGQMSRFRKLAPNMCHKPNNIPREIWPIEKIWQD